MADQKISELQLVVATGVAATGIYVPLYTPMLAPANRRISAAEFFKTPKRIEISDSALAGTGEVMTLTTSYGTASLRVGTGGQFIVGGDFAAVGGISNISDSSPFTLGLSSDVKLYRDASGVLALRYGPNAQSLKVYNSYTGTHNEFVTLRFLSGAAQLGTFQDGTGIARTLNVLTSGVTRISAPAASGSPVVITSYDTSQGGVLDLTSPLGTANLRVGAGGQLVTLAAFSAAGDVSLISDSAALKLGLSSDAQLFRDAADTLAQRRNTNAQAFRLYNTYVSAGVNEYLNLGFSANTALLGTLRSGSGIVRNLDLQASGVSRLNIPAASGSATTITSYDTAQGNVLALTSPLGTASLRVGAGGQLVNVGNFASVGEIAVVSDSSALKLGTSSDVGFLRSASGLARVVDISSSNYASLEAKRFVSVFGSAVTGNSAPMISGSQTWNDGSVTFVGLGFNITDNGSNALSKAIDIQVNGTGVLSVQKNGTITTNYIITNAAASAGLYARSNTGLVAFGISDDVVITRDAADVAAQRRATNAQNFRIYNSYVSAGVNEYLNLGFSSANVAQIGTLRSGSGIVRDLNILSSGIPRITVPAAHTSAVSVSGLLNVSGTVTGATSTPALAVSQTWDNPTTAFNAMTVSIIPSNSSASSNFIEFFSSGTSYAKLTQFGDWQSASFTASDGNTRIGSSGIKVGVTAQYTFVHATGASSQNIAAGLTLGGSGVVRVTDGFANTGSITVRNTNSTVFSIPDGVSVDINPASGAIQTWVLGSGRTPTANNFAAGQSVTLMIDDGSGFNVNWGTMGVSWLNSTPPALPTSGYGVVELWKVGSTIYGTSVGNVV